MRMRQTKINCRHDWTRKFALPIVCLLLLICLVAAGCRTKDALLTDAQAAWDREDWKTAVSRYEEFLQDSSPSTQVAEVHFKTANIYYLNLKEYDRAAEHYIRLIEDSPDFKDMELAYLRLAECHVEVKKFREAISEYENLLKTFPDTPNRRKIRLEIANLYYEYDKSQALVEYQKVVKDAPYDSLAEKAYLRLGGVRQLRNEFEAAIAPYQAVVDNTQDANVRRQTRDQLATCYENAGKYDEAIKILEQTEPDPTAPDYFKKRIEGVRGRQKTRKLIQLDSGAPNNQPPQ